MGSLLTTGLMFTGRLDSCTLLLPLLIAGSLVQHSVRQVFVPHGDCDWRCLCRRGNDDHVLGLLHLVPVHQLRHLCGYRCRSGLSPDRLHRHVVLCAAAGAGQRTVHFRQCPRVHYTATSVEVSSGDVRLPVSLLLKCSWTG